MPYITRKIFSATDLTIVTEGIRQQQNILLLGPRGSGKTSLARAAAEQLGRTLATVPCHTGAGAELLLGQWVPRTDGTGYRWMDGVLTRAVRCGQVCLLDEVNALKPEVAFAIHGLLDHRRELVLTDKPGADDAPEVVTANPNFALIAAGNPLYEGVRVMNEAFRDRFAVQLVVRGNAELDAAVLRASAAATYLDPEQVNAICVFAGVVRSAVQNQAVASDISTRAFLDLAMNLACHSQMVARTLFLNRFDDPAEVAALRACFKEVWTMDGTVLAQPAAPPTREAAEDAALRDEAATII